MRLARGLAMALGTLVGSVPFTGANAQEFPAKVITMVVGVPPGGSADFLARTAAEGMSRSLGKTIIVDNRPGANSIIATRAVARAPADGYTLFFNATNMASNLVGMKDPGYKWSDFDVVGGIAYAPFVMFVNTASSKAKTLREFVDFGKANPGKLTYGSLGAGSAPGLVAARFNDQSRLGYREVPYKGGGQALQDLLGGTVDVYFTLPNSANVTAQPNIAALAVAGNKRSEHLPDVPTFAELGYPGMQDVSMGGLWVPAGTPKPVLEKLRKALADAVRDPTVVAALKKGGQTPYEGDAQKFDKDMRGFETLARDDYRKFKIEPQ